MKHKIRAKLEEKRSALHEGKNYLLLVLDIRTVLPTSDGNLVKVLVTKRKSEETPSEGGTNLC